MMRRSAMNNMRKGKGNNTILYIIIGVVVASIVGFLIWYYMNNADDEEFGDCKYSFKNKRWEYGTNEKNCRNNPDIRTYNIPKISCIQNYIDTNSKLDWIKELNTNMSMYDIKTIIDKHGGEPLNCEKYFNVYNLNCLNTCKKGYTCGTVNSCSKSVWKNGWKCIEYEGPFQFNKCIKGEDKTCGTRQKCPSDTAIP